MWRESTVVTYNLNPNCIAFTPVHVLFHRTGKVIQDTHWHFGAFKVSTGVPGKQQDLTNGCWLKKFVNQHYPTMGWLVNMAFKISLVHYNWPFLYLYFCGSTSTIIKTMQFLKTCIDLPFVGIPWAVTQGHVSRHQKYLPLLTDCQYEKKERCQAKQTQTKLAFLNLRKSCSGGGQNRSHQPK